MATVNLVTQPYGRIIINVPQKQADVIVGYGRARIATDSEVQAARTAPEVVPGTSALVDFAAP